MIDDERDRGETDDEELARYEGEREIVEERWREFKRGEIKHFIEPRSTLEKKLRGGNKVNKNLTYNEEMFILQHRRLALSAEDIFIQTAEKRGLLKATLGYITLLAQKSEAYPAGRIPLEYCKRERIGEVYKERVRTLSKKYDR